MPILFTLFLSLLSSVNFLSAKPQYIKNTHLIPIEKRQPAPSFYFNKTANSIAFKNQVVYFNFWAEWCKPCKEEIPFLIQLRNFFNYPVFKMVFINMDKREHLEKAKIFWKQNAKDAPSLFSSEFDFKNEFTIKQIPSHIIVDKKGRIALQFFGNINEQKMATNVKKWVFQLIQE